MNNHTNTNAHSQVNVNSQLAQFYSGKTVVITGVAGFVPSHLAEELLSLGAIVVGIDNFLTGRPKNLAEIEKHPQASNFHFIEADVIAKPETYLPLHKAYMQSIAAIFHMASPASPPLYQAHPVETYQVNSFATHYLLDFIRNSFPQARFMFASTSEVYGDPEVHPQPETYWGMVNPNGVRSCYDEAKRLGESICGVFERDFGVDVRIMRIFNTYGPRMDPKDGRVIPNFVKQALENDSMTIYGTGGQTRSYCYVSDLVAGIARLGGLPGLKGQTINIGNPDEYTILETAKVIYSEIHGNDLPESLIDFRPLPGDDPVRRRPDITKAQEILGWSPTVSLLEGLGHTIAYFRDSEEFLI